MLEAIQLSCSYGERFLFKDVGLNIGPGEALRVDGENGSGKTSLLKMLCGLTSPIEGLVRWRGQNINKINSELNRELIYLGHATALKRDLTASENLVFGSTLAGDRITLKEAYSVLSQGGLVSIVDSLIKSLSQGQCKRVAQARLRLTSMRKLWILDEPFTALDKGAVQDLIGVMNNHLENDGILIYTTHQEIELNARNFQFLNLNDYSIC